MNHFYFLGLDPAPALKKSADDGALVALRARPRMAAMALSPASPLTPALSPLRGEGEGIVLTSNPVDWICEYVWAYRLRGASAREWSGFVHAKHQQFGFTKICLDPQGGGYWVMQEMNKSRQLIHQIETECTPIVSLEEEGVVLGAFILTLFKRSDPGIKALWPLLQGDDLLVDAMHVVFQQALEHVQVVFPPAFDDVPPEVKADWSQEKSWASKTLTAVGAQLANIQVATLEDGRWETTARGARKFSASGRKDLAYAAIYAYVAFLAWLKTNGGEFDGGQDGGEAMFGVM